MKIVIAGPAHPFRGGIADTNEAMCRSLNQEGHQAVLVTFTMQYPGFLFPGKTQYSEDPKPEDLEIYRWVNSVNPINWIRTAKKINRLNPDILIVRYWIPFMAPALGGLAQLVSRKAVKLAMCDNILPHERRMMDTPLTKYFVSKFDGFITLSKTVKEELKEFTQKPVFHFPHPINDQLGKIANQNTSRDKLQLDKDGKYLLFFGFVRKYKGLDLLLDALADDQLNTMNIKLIVAGEFYDNPDIYYNQMDQLDLNDRVIVFNQFIPSSDVPYYFAAADLITQTYHTASQSGVSQMALHFEKPILVTDVGGLSEVVKHGETGYVVPKEPGEIASAICDYFAYNRQESFRQSIIKLKPEYSWKTFSKGLAGFIKEIQSTRSQQKN